MKIAASIILTAIILPWLAWASLEIIDLGKKVPKIIDNVQRLDNIENKIDLIRKDFHEADKKLDRLLSRD